MEAARALGLNVPADLSVVGFDDIEVSSYAGLTTVRQPLFEGGRKAAELLLQALGTNGPVTPYTHLLDLQLIVRATTAQPAAS
jgi:LacI family transcriptional regulator